MAEKDATELRLHKQLMKYANDVSTLHKDLKKENTLLKRANKELEEYFVETAFMGFDLINLQDEFMGGHCKRVSHYSESLAKSLTKNKKTITNVKVAALLHDIGLLGIPKADLISMFSGSKMAQLDIFINHPLVKMRPITTTRKFKDIANIIATHHENMDGSGFPKGLKKDKIPFEARIINIASAYDVLKNLNPGPVKPDDVVAKIVGDVGLKYDAKIFEKFTDMILTADPLAVVINIDVEKLVPGMIAAAPIMAAGDTKLIAADTEIRENHLVHIRRYHEFDRLKLPIKIYKPI